MKRNPNVWYVKYGKIFGGKGFAAAGAAYKAGIAVAAAIAAAAAAAAA